MKPYYILAVELLTSNIQSLQQKDIKADVVLEEIWDEHSCAADVEMLKALAMSLQVHYLLEYLEASFVSCSTLRQAWSVAMQEVIFEFISFEDKNSLMLEPYVMKSFELFTMQVQLIIKK